MTARKSRSEQVITDQYVGGGCHKWVIASFDDIANKTFTSRSWPPQFVMVNACSRRREVAPVV